MSQILQVSDIRRETEDSLLITFEIPQVLRKQYSYHPGQFITIEAQIDGKTYKRPYSLCGNLQDKGLSIVVKRVPGGTVSNYLNDAVKPGASFKVHTPQGSFSLVPSMLSAHHYVFFAAGCGITPIISMIEAIMKNEPFSKVSLFYSNKSKDNTIFRERLGNLSEQHSKRLSIQYMFTAEVNSDAMQGRLDSQKCKYLISERVKSYKSAKYFMCGPTGFMDSILSALEEMEVPSKNVKMEYFSPTHLIENYENPAQWDNSFSVATEVEVVIDRKAHKIQVAPHQTILASALAADLDANYSCRAGVCSFCKARVLSGQVSCSSTGSLSPKEIQQGFILTCQSHPASADVKIEYCM
jgi:ring-1,2-phenylacetyl-CoA epoxidase subunit PaaE